MKAKMKIACPCCADGEATFTYKLLTVDAAIVFCSKHLGFFKTCAGDIREGVEMGTAALSKAAAKAVEKLTQQAREE